MLWIELISTAYFQTRFFCSFRFILKINENFLQLNHYPIHLARLQEIYSFHTFESTFCFSFDLCRFKISCAHVQLRRSQNLMNIWKNVEKSYVTVGLLCVVFQRCVPRLWGRPCALREWGGPWALPQQLQICSRELFHISSKYRWEHNSLTGKRLSVIVSKAITR